MNRAIIKITLPLILALALLITGCSMGFEPSSVSVMARIGEAAPEFQLQNFAGETVSLSDFRGQPVLINFWATWCPSCRAEMPYLQQIYEEWSDRGLILLAIDIGESRETVAEFMQENNLTLPVLFDSDSKVTENYNIIAIPTTYFIDKDGIIRNRKIGDFKSKEEIEQFFNRLLP